MPSPARSRGIDVSKALFGLSVGLLLFLGGVGVGRYRVFPYQALEFGKMSLNDTWTAVQVAVSGRPEELVRPAHYEGRGVTKFVRTESRPGLTLLSGFFDNGNEIRLIRPDGSNVRRWPVRLFDIFPDVSHVRPARLAPKTNWNVEVQGIVALPDGSLVFNFQGVGTAKLDRCGKTVWTLPRGGHHSLEPAGDGGFWVPSQRYIEHTSPFPVIEPPYMEETILKVSGDGKVTREISALGLLFKNDMQALLFANGLKGTALAAMFPDLPNDITHLNDVEELAQDMAPHFPQFAAGDLLVSLRSLNMILVVDPETERVKWHQVGPWIKQHDPDFAADGTISVFNNNDDGTKTGSILGGSNIMEVNPASGATTVAYGARPGEHMYSDIMGKHQRLDDGHLLVTETQSGRVFEVNREGRLVWEYINRYNDREVAIVTQAIRYPEDYFKVGTWACP